MGCYALKSLWAVMLANHYGLLCPPITLGCYARQSLWAVMLANHYRLLCSPTAMGCYPCQLLSAVMLADHYGAIMLSVLHDLPPSAVPVTYHYIVWGCYALSTWWSVTLGSTCDLSLWGCYALGTCVIHQIVCYPKRYMCTILARGYALGTCVLHYGG